MRKKLDYYTILQVPPSAEIEEIKAAYHRLAAKYHPDISQIVDAHERMTQINAAYEVLSNPPKRTLYDTSRGFTSTASGLIRARSFSTIWLTVTTAFGALLLAILALRLLPSVFFRLVVVILIVWVFNE